MKILKRKAYIIIILIITNLAFPTGKLSAQTTPFTTGLSIKGGAGLSTFFGDLGAPGLSVLSYTKAGLTGSVIKMFNPVFGVQLQYSGVNLHSQRTDYAQYFDGFINEIGLAARLELLPMLAPSLESRIQPYLKAGIATTMFRSVKRQIGTNTIYLPAYGYANDGLTKAAAQNALSIPLGIGLGIKLTENISFELEQAFSLTNTDLLDAAVGTANTNDMFGFTQVGLKLTLHPITQTVKTPAQGVHDDNRGTSRSRSQRRGDDDPAVAAGIPVSILVQSVIPEKPVSGKIFEVLIKLNKDDYTGRAVLTQSFPKGFTAMESEISDATFSFTNQKVRIIWDALPPGQMVEYSYLVRPSESTRGNYTVNGSLEYRQADGPRVVHFANYLEVTNPVEARMDSRILDLIGDDEEQTKETKTQQQGEGNLDLKLEDLLKRYGGETRKQEETVATENQQQGDIRESGVGTAGTEFRIQIGAFRDKNQGRAIIKRYNLPETVTEEFADGLYKYTLGSFRSYNDAVQFRDAFIRRTQIWSAFIVAYQNGIRVKNLQDLIK